DVAPVPRAHFRAELRAQLVAVAPRLVPEGVAAEEPLTGTRETAPVAARTARMSTSHSAPGRVSTRGAAGTLAGLRSISLGKPVAIVTAVVAAFALMLGGSVWLSKHAL